MASGKTTDNQELDIARMRKVIDRLKRLTVKYRQAEVVQKALFRISELAASVRDMAQFYPSVHSIIGELMSAKNFYICLYDEGEGLVEFVYFVDEYDEIATFDQLPVEDLSRGLTGYILRSGRPFLCTNDAFDDLKLRGEVEAMGAAPVDWLGVPLMSGNKVLGAMVVQSYNEEVRYDESDKELLTFVSQHVVNALERLRQREMMRAEIAHQTSELRHANESLMKEISVRERAERQTAVLFAISELTNTSKDMNSFYHSLHDEIGKLLHAENFFIALVSDDKKHLDFPYYADGDDRKGRKRRMGKGMTEYVIRRRSSDFIDKPRFQALLKAKEIEHDAKYGRPPTQWLGSPLMLNDRVFGVLAVQSYDAEFVYQQDDLELLNFVSQHVAVAIERKRNAEEIQRVNTFLEKKVEDRTEELVNEIERRKKIEAKLYHDAHHDSLTGLPNRSLFTERLQHAINHKRRHPESNFAVLFVDLDRFKNINDTLGHSAGDRFLLEVSQRIGECVRENDTVARLGGDEFVILLDTIQKIDDAKEIASRIIEQMRKPFVYDGSEHYSGASVGIAECQASADSAERLLRDADAAMYHAKGQGRGRFVLFEESIHEGLVASLNSEAAFRQANFNTDFVLHHQPIVALAGQQVVGFEALVRWQRGNELIVADDFIELAQKTGTLQALDRWVLDQSCAMLASRQKKGLATPPLHVNISVRHLMKSARVRELMAIIERHEVDPGSLVFEFNETALVEDGKRLVTSLRQLAEFGIGLALDDFGRGLGSLQFIYYYPFNYLKLDKEFVSYIPESDRAQAMVRNVVALCGDLGITIYAEGVETDVQRQMLLELGVTSGQGTLLGASQPLKPAEDVTSICA